MGRITKRRMKRRNRTSRIWISLIVIMMAGVFTVRIYSLRQQGEEYEDKRISLQKQLQEEEERAKELKEEETYRQTRKYIEDYAHNQLGLVYPGEIIFKAQE